MPDFLDSEHTEVLRAAERLADELTTLFGKVAESDIGAAVREASKAAGVFGMTQPASFGGTEAGALALTVVRDTLGSRNVGHLPGIFGPSPGVLANVGEPLRSQFLLPYLAGELRSGFGFTEPADAPRHTWAMCDGDELVINGAKSYVTGGADADFINALVEIEGAGTAMVLIETDRAGVTLEQRFGTLDGSHHAAFAFADVRVPDTHLIGEAGRGLGRAMGQINATRLAIAADCVGQCRFAIDLVEQTLTERAARRGSTDEPARVGTDLERVTLGDMRIAAYAARSALYRTARLLDAGENAVNEVMAAKSLATETLSRICDSAVQFVGGTALVDGHPLADILRRVRALRLAEGPTEVLAANVARGRLDLGLGRV
ncbi:acyl-CoA dehydrogenase family protein [Candidatus Poriferisodalis sp.]|uniref:acyl-CoA dehydrogenase family protein n=1 Tax=Candidatus Poriferisodalis sp. TaxID=3101277 RepID=UPI003B014FB5